MFRLFLVSILRASTGPPYVSRFEPGGIDGSVGDDDNAESFGKRVVKGLRTAYRRGSLKMSVGDGHLR